MRKIYISGPITGIENYEENFSSVEKVLELKGYEVVNPVKIGEKLIALFEDRPVPYSSFMRADLKALLECTHIYMLDNWYKSKGAIVEYMVAKICGLKVIHVGSSKTTFSSWRMVLEMLTHVLTKSGDFDA